ncbi:MAG TPA: hypothetical protein VIJ85_04840 [Rhizomicrobium sp.]
MRFEVPWRKVATGGGVLLLHLLLVLLLLTTTGLLPIADLGHPREIFLTLAPPPRPKTQEAPAPIIQEQIPVPLSPLPPVENPAFTAPPPPPSQRQQTPGDVYGLGRYLFNCSGEYYEQLSAQEKEHCLRNRWNGQKPAEQQPLLGPAKPSPFDQVIKERNRDAAPIEKQCPPDAPQSNLGLPCYDFSGHHLLEEQPGH